MLRPRGPSRCCRNDGWPCRPVPRLVREYFHADDDTVVRSLWVGRPSMRALGGGSSAGRASRSQCEGRGSIPSAPPRTTAGPATRPFSLRNCHRAARFTRAAPVVHSRARPGSSVDRATASQAVGRRFNSAFRPGAPYSRSPKKGRDCSRPSRCPDAGQSGADRGAPQLPLSPPSTGAALRADQHAPHRCWP